MRIVVAVVAYILGALALANHAPGPYENNKQPLDIRLFHSLNRVGVAVVSPDATKALFTQSHYDQDENKSATFISVLDLTSGVKKQLTPDVIGESFSNPLWFDNGSIGYMHKGSLYRQRLQDPNGTAIYKPAIDVSSVGYRPGHLTFVASVYPNMTTLAQMKKRNESAETKKIDSAQIFDNLWVRHWDEWMTLKKPNVFSVPISNDSNGWVFGEEINLMNGLPVFHDPLIRWSADEYTVDRQGVNVAFVVRNPSDDMAWQTNVDVYIVPIRGNKSPKLLSGSAAGAASGPAFSPDGKYIAWLQMETPAYESDINRIYIHDIASDSTASIARDWELSPLSLLWSSDGKSIYAVVGDKGNNVVYAVDVATGKCQQLTENGSASGLRLLGSDKLVLIHADQDKCSNVHVLDIGTRDMRQLTDVNKDKLKDIYIGPAEDFWFEGARGDKVHGWLVKPLQFDPTKKYPLIYLVHGGPQQYNTHTFSYAQGNPNMYASAGFVTVQVNFHGSASYGQNFTDSIFQQWGGYPYEDLMKGLDYLLQTRSYIDKSRMAAMGASYGGYMMNWFNGHTDRFKALVNHDGMYSTTGFWHSTEELWFPEHDFGGVPYDTKARIHYEQFNPERFAANFSTPTLFIQGGNDFRLTVEQSLAPFTLLRRKGVAARLMYFADENHWITRTGNSVKWYTEVLRWIAEFTNTTLPYKLNQPEYV